MNKATFYKKVCQVKMKFSPAKNEVDLFDFCTQLHFCIFDHFLWAYNCLELKFTNFPQKLTLFTTTFLKKAVLNLTVKKFYFQTLSLPHPKNKIIFFFTFHSITLVGHWYSIVENPKGLHNNLSLNLISSTKMKDDINKR